MIVIGLMSGTSMDAVDTALVEFHGGQIRLLDYAEYEIDESIRGPVRQLNVDSSPAEISKYDALLASLFADAVNRMVARSGMARTDIRAVGSHGQTILHLPDDDPPRTLQIGDGAIIARLTGITTVADFRSMDLLAGGQGAPLAPALHASQFRSTTADRCILNLGGIANITVLPADKSIAVTGFDTGPGNGLMDDWNRRHRNTNMDTAGAWAGSGTINQTLLARLRADPYFLRSPPKSSGRDYFNLAWLENIVKQSAPGAGAADIQATLLQLTASTIADAVTQLPVPVTELYLCGGGTHNPVLVARLAGLLPGITIQCTDVLGIDPDAVEAVTFAWLAKQRLDGLPGNLPSVTGAREAVLLGTVYKPD